MKKNTNSRHILRMVFVVVIVIALVLLYCIGSFTYVFAETRNGVDITATGAAIYVDESNSFVWDYQGDKQYNPASTTKLLTCLIAAEQLNTSDVVTVTKEALNVADTQLFLKEGEEITVGNLMCLALMESQNEAAKMLAIAVAGSEEEFTVIMNSRAKQIGCLNSTFGNSTGLIQNRNYATAKDMCLITQEAFKNTTVRNICGQATYELPASNKNEAKELKNSNLFLNGGTFKNLDGDKVKVEEIPEVYGGKTGTTNKHKTTMCVACEIEGINVYITILNSSVESRYTDVKRLVEYSRSLIQPYKALDKGTVFDEKAKVKNGAVGRVAGEAKTDGYINLLEGASAALVLVEPVFSEDLTAPIYKGDVIGQAVIYLADEPVSSVDIIAVEGVEEGWIFSKIGIPNSVALPIIILIVLIAIIATVISTLRSINRAKAKARRKERIKQLAQKQIDREASAKERNWPY